MKQFLIHLPITDLVTVSGTDYCGSFVKGLGHATGVGHLWRAQPTVNVLKVSNNVELLLGRHRADICKQSVVTLQAISISM